MEPEKQPRPSCNGSGPVLVALVCVALLLCGTSLPVLSSPADSTAVIAPAAAPDTEAAEPKQSTNQSQLFPPKMALGRLYVLPLVSYADERGFGVGGEFLFPFRLSGNSPESHPSELRARAQVTFKGQTQLDLASTVYWKDGTHVLRARVSHRDTAERFYGIGPDTPQSNEEVYRPHRFQAYVEGFHNVLPYFRAGVRVEMEFFEFLERVPGGLLQAPVYSSSSGEKVIGAGFVLEWDRRDQRYAPSHGYYYQAFGMLFDDALGSDFDFTNFNVDLRNYFTIKPQHVLATQVFLYGTTDSPPFWRLASLGGRAHSRGYRRDRYLDEVLFAVQAEYRAPVLWRLSLTGFGGTAAVAPQISKFRYDTLRPTLGIGLNVHYRKNHAIVARFDTALGQEGVRFGLAINESF